MSETITDENNLKINTIIIYLSGKKVDGDVLDIILSYIKHDKGLIEMLMVELMMHFEVGK